MSKPAVRFVFGLHLHQPVGNFDYVFADHLRDVYRPIIERAAAAGFLPLTVHLSGPLLEWLDVHEPKFLDLIGSLAAEGKLELMLAGFDEPILASLPRPDRLEQVGRMREFLKRRFGVAATGLWLTERVWEPELAADLHDAGVGYALLDDRHFLVSGFSRDELHRPFNTESDGRGIRLLAIDERLRYLIPFRPPEETAAYLRQLREQGHTLAVVADDGEKFGGWPGTKEWVYDRGWLAQFFEVVGKLLADGEAVLTTAKDAVRDTPAAGLAYLPTASYREMEAWSLPAAAQSRLAKFEEHLGPERMAGGTGALVRGGHWRHFLVKYPESNRLHKSMVALSALARARGDPPVARRAIGRAQCNDAYWHGVFGGLYLPHLRRALWGQLAIAERELRAGEGLGCDVLDLDLDGFDELWVHGPGFSSIISPRRGGAIEALTRFAAEENLADTLTRRRESYHDAAIAAGTPPPVDMDVRAVLVDRVVAGDLAERILSAGTYPTVRSWSLEPLAPAIAGDATGVRIVLTGAGLEKTLVFKPDGGLSASWRWDRSAYPESAFFATELSLARDVAVETVPAAEVWRHPITTVAKSERGLEETLQGTSIMARWPVSAGTASLTIP